MKVAALISVVICCIFAISLFVVLGPTHTNVPQLKKAQPPALVKEITYDFLGSRPFEAGKMWFAANRVVFVYDLDKRQVMGELTNAWPELLFGDPPKILCSQALSGPVAKGLRERFTEFTDRVFRHRVNFRPPGPIVTYWLLDLSNNKAKSLGQLIGIPNFSFHPSPDLHFGFTARSGPNGSPEYYLFDLQHPSIKNLEIPLWVFDWWDSTRILVCNTNHDFLLYDIGKRTTAPFISQQSIAAFFQKQSLSDDPKKVQAFAIWNGRANDFYLTDTHQKWLAEESFLIKVERPDGRLSLVSPHFKFEWSDHLDAKGHRYLYTGRESGDGSDGVFVRNLDTGATMILVSATTNKYFSIPRINRDSVVYVRSNGLWQVGLDGSNNVRLFPPASSGIP